MIKFGKVVIPPVTNAMYYRAMLKGVEKRKAKERGGVDVDTSLAERSIFNERVASKKTV